MVSDHIDALILRDYDSDTDGTSVCYYYTQDTIFNVVSILGSTGTVLERYGYTPYGQAEVLDANFAADSDGLSDMANDATFTGQRFDAESAAYALSAQVLSSRPGQVLLARDPIGYEGSKSNLCQYVGARPVVNVDPLGLSEAEQMCRAGWEFVSGPSKDAIHGKELPTTVVQPGSYYKANTFWISFFALGPTLQTNECGKATSGTFSLSWTKEKTVNGGVDVGYFGFGFGYAIGNSIEVSIDVSLPAEKCYNFLAVAVGQKLSVRHEVIRMERVIMSLDILDWER